VSSSSGRSDSLTARERQALFVELASRDSGVTAQDAFEAASARGDSVTQEAFHNLGRRLAHRGILVADKSGRQTIYRAGADVDGQWLDEEEIAAIVDPEYPLIALTAARESMRQLRDVPDEVWIEARERLAAEDAQTLFLTAIKAYADHLRDGLAAYDDIVARNGPERERVNMRRDLEAEITVLRALGKFGIGASAEAITVPANVEHGVGLVRKSPNEPLYREETLKEEISRRVEPGPIIRQVPTRQPDKNMLVAAIDGSTRGGLLAVDGALGDFAFGHAPQVSINTATGLVNRNIKAGTSQSPAFFRLPEKPEDMQQKDNKYTIMAKVFYPDLSDSEYIHSSWNAMDLLETKATLTVMSRWYTPKTSLEIRPADVVLRDGTIVPHDRDSNHYGTPGSYGQIVRDLIETSWRIVQKCRDDGQTVAGVVKNAQMSVLAPVINYFLCQLAAKRNGTQLTAWPLRAMNALPDQTLVTRLLTAGRKAGDPWVRTAMVLRPFHATSDFGARYSRASGSTPAEVIMKRAEEAKSKADSDLRDTDWIWRDIRGASDPFVRMLQNAWYAGFYLAALPRLDRGEVLPRLEVLIPHATAEEGQFPADLVAEHSGRLLDGIALEGFEVAADHSFFDNAGSIDILPRLLIRAHETVKVWATELLSRVREYMDYHLAKYLKPGSPRPAIRIRKWRREELITWISQMQDERAKQGGSSSGKPPR